MCGQDLPDTYVRTHPWALRALRLVRTYQENPFHPSYKYDLQDGKQPIHIAVREGLLNVVKYLIDDLKVNPRTPLEVHT